MRHHARLTVHGREFLCRAVPEGPWCCAKQSKYVGRALQGTHLLFPRADGLSCIYTQYAYLVAGAVAGGGDSMAPVRWCGPVFLRSV
jgi:hypothetical protein